MRQNHGIPLFSGGLAVASLLVFGGCRAAQKSDASDVKFIGGTAAEAGQYPSSVYFQHCTAAKIGPRHFLTAAHCLYQNELDRPAFLMVPGTKAQILVGISLEKGKLVPVTITSTASYPGFSYATLAKDYLKAEPPTAGADQLPTSVDLAVVTVEEATPELPFVELDDTPLEANTSVTVGGYGCEQEGSKDNANMRLKYATVPVASLRGTLAFWKAQSETEGYRSTCHGDSGGPVYRDVQGERKITGVNSGSPAGYSAFTHFSGTEGAKALAWIRKKVAEPVTAAPMTFKIMQCKNAVASAPSQDGVLRTYDFIDLRLAISGGRKISASIDKFKVTIHPDDPARGPAYALTVAEAAGCEAGVLCYKVLYTDPTTTEKKLLAVQMKEGKVSVYEGEPVEGQIPLGVALDPKSCELSNLSL